LLQFIFYNIQNAAYIYANIGKAAKQLIFIGIIASF